MDTTKETTTNVFPILLLLVHSFDLDPISNLHLDVSHVSERELTCASGRAHKTQVYRTKYSNKRKGTPAACFLMEFIR